MTIKNVLLEIWQFPQHITALIVKRIYKAIPYTTYKGSTVYLWKLKAGLSLGRHIFVPKEKCRLCDFGVQQYIKHEYGHTIQSKYLGWFYLLIIGLPSLIWAGCFKKYRQKHGVSYYSFYTEKWADKLGGVTRSF